jgi:APA family basic amino acid/polyamine antiporter
LLVTKYAGDPVLGIVKQLDFGAFQHAAELYVGLLAGTILLIATNAGIIGVSRLTYSMGQHRQMPEIVRRLHPRFKTPYVAIIAFACIASLAILPGQADFLGKVYAFGAMLSFTIAHMSVIALRWKHPEYERTYRGPGLVMFRDHEVPIFAVIGFLGTFAAWLTVFGRDKLVFLGGLIWVGLGLAMYATYRHRIGLTLTESSSIVTPKAIVEHEVEYDSILVVFEDGAFSEEAVQTAVKMATRRRRGVHVLVTITVPASAPVNAVLPAAESAANSAIDRARVVGGRRVSGHWEKVRAGEAGRRIVHEAEEINARAIVIPVKRDSAGSLFSSAVQKVLSDRPCRVIITTGDPNPKLAEVS